MQKLRLFTAITLSEELRNNLGALTEQLRDRIHGSFAWVRSENFHLTLSFLGETGVDRLEEIDSAMSKAISEITPFGFDVEGVGAFPDQEEPRVVWAGVTGFSELLTSCQENVANELAGLGFRKEKQEYHPHITLARVKSLHGGGTFARGVAEFEHHFAGEQWVESVALMESRSMPEGRQYVEVSRYHFG